MSDISLEVDAKTNTTGVTGRARVKAFAFYAVQTATALIIASSTMLRICHDIGTYTIAIDITLGAGTFTACTDMVCAAFVVAFAAVVGVGLQIDATAITSGLTG
jgi:uncharacterized protein (UPF0212 family)